MSTLSEAFVPLIPRPMTLPSCTKTQPTGVSSEARASSAISMALRMKPSWYSRLGTGSKTVRFAIFLGLARSGYWRIRLPSMQHSVPWWRGWGCAINAGSTFRRRPVHRLWNFVWKARVGGDVRASEWKARRTCRSHYKNYVHVPTSLRIRQVRGAFRRRTMCVYIYGQSNTVETEAAQEQQFASAVLLPRHSSVAGYRQDHGMAIMDAGLPSRLRWVSLAMVRYQS